MSRTPPVLLLLLAGTLAGGIAPRVQAAQTTALLSGPDVGAFEATPDVASVAFNRSQSDDGPAQVYVVPLGGASTPLSPPGVSAGLVMTTADSQSVVYLVSGNTPSAGLYLVPIS